tara:strand:+ start:61475 stop:62188 length:714 start_codon:yes stop_codon:yes gene_type:complete
MLAPGEGELHLWFCRRELVAGSEPFQREVLSRYAGVAPTDLNFAKGPHGKPALSSPHLSLAFNLSNCRDRLVMAISAGAAVGVDLEYCDPRRDVEKLAQRFFSATEMLQMRACAGAPKIDRFYDYWTLKEAAIKATGGSLGRELEATSFDLRESVGLAGEGTPGSITALTSPVDGQAWFGLLQPFDEYRLAICCIAADDFSAGILQFDWPHDTPQMCSPRLLASSSVDSKTAWSASL